jgi:hypothetical protein
MVYGVRYSGSLSAEGGSASGMALLFVSFVFIVYNNNVRNLSCPTAGFILMKEGQNLPTPA